MTNRRHLKPFITFCIHSRNSLIILFSYKFQLLPRAPGTLAFSLLVFITRRVYLFPSRTQKSSFVVPMVLPS